MNTREIVAKRIIELCEERCLAVYALAKNAGVPPSTVYSMLTSETKDIGVASIKKLCDSLGITLGEFFSTPEFDALEQEIQ